MTWRSLKVEDQRQRLIISYLNKTATMSELCKEFGISRKTGYKWVKRYKTGGLDALLDQSKAPKNPAKKYSKELISLALKCKQEHQKYGPKKIRAVLLRRHPDIEVPSATRLYTVFKEHHLVSSRKLRRRVARTHPLGYVNASNDVWSIDFKGWFYTEDQIKVEPLTITDGHTRFLIECKHLEEKDADSVWKILECAFKKYGLPKRMRSDNGPPFATLGAGRLSELSIKLIKAGVLPEWIAPGHPEENGRHERFHKSLKDAVANPPAVNFEEQVQRMAAYIDEYNFERPHEALNQEVPGSHYSPSEREWDGILKEPKYNLDEMMLRKVALSGCITIKRKEYYIGKALTREYVGLRSIGHGVHQVYYGPVYLGKLTEGGKLVNLENVLPMSENSVT